jgi:hypothetical protein
VPSIVTTLAFYVAYHVASCPMKRQVYWVPLAVAYFAAATAALVGFVEGCGGEREPGELEPGAYTCEFPVPGHNDEWGRPDPCCEFSVCCSNPLLDHWAISPYYDPPRKMWDPCCMTEACPGHNVFLPADAGVPSNEPDAGDAGTDAHASTCDGKCVPANPEGWWGPVLLWHGPVNQEPLCPGQAPIDFYHGRADLSVDSISCGQCVCDAPTGTCSLPSKFTAASSTCQSMGPTTIYSSFDPPPAWDGSCTALGSIPAGALCNGVPCVKSLTIAPLTLTEDGCTPHAIGAEPPSRLTDWWTTAAVGCQLNDIHACDGGKEVCAPFANSSLPGFSTCVFRDVGVDKECPKDYPERHVFYDDFDDTRACTECTCNPPQGSQCTAVASIFKDAACSVPIPLITGITADAEPFCYNPPPGSALGSKTVSAPTYTPGSCAPTGGELTGAVSLLGEAVFCCLQS